MHSIRRYVTLVFILLISSRVVTPNVSLMPAARAASGDERQYSNIASLAWSPDGKKLAVGRLDRKVVVWGAGSQQIVMTLEGHTREVFSVDWSPDGTRIVSGGPDGTIIIWDATNGSRLKTIEFPLVESHLGPVFSVAWNPSSTQIAAAGDTDVRTFDAETGDLLQVLRDHRQLVLSVDWSPDGNDLASGSWDGTIKIWSMVTGQPLQTILTPRKFGVNVVAWSPDGNSVAGGYQGNDIHVWNPFSGELLTTLQGHTSSIESLSWRPQGDLLASTSLDDNTIRIWNVGSGQTVQIIDAGTRVLAVAWNPDGTQLAYGGEADNLEIVNAPSLNCTSTIAAGDVPDLISAINLTKGTVDPYLSLTDSIVPNVIRRADSSPQQANLSQGVGVHHVIAMDWHPSDHRLVLGYYDGVLEILDTETKQKLFSADISESPVHDVNWSPDGSKLAVASGAALYLYDATTFQQMKNLRYGYRIQVKGIAWSPDSTWLASANQYTTMQPQVQDMIIWDINSGQVLQKFPVPHTQLMSSVAWSPDGKQLLTGSIDQTAIVWDIATLKPVMTLQAHDYLITEVSWSEDGTKIAVTNSYIDDAITITDAATGRRLSSYAGSRINDMTWHPDSTRLAIADENSVRIVDSLTGQTLDTLSTTGEVDAVAWSPDGARLAYGGEGGNVEIIDTSPLSNCAITIRAGDVTGLTSAINAANANADSRCTCKPQTGWYSLASLWERASQ